MPQLVQILLPVADNAGQPFPSEHYNAIRTKLTGMFGGLTAYTRAPAEGFWNSGSSLAHDDIMVAEVMVETLDRSWWKEYRRELERLFRQQEIIIRAQEYERL